MSDETKVWITQREGKRGPSWRLRWIDTRAKCWRSMTVKGEKEAYKQAGLIERGMVQVGKLRPVTWAEFAAEHVRGYANAGTGKQIRQTLAEFGKLYDVRPHAVTYRMVEAYRQWLRDRKRKENTIQRKLKQLSAAFAKGVARGYCEENPMTGWTWEKIEQKAMRIFTDAEEAAMLKAAADVGGLRWVGLVRVGLDTGGRRSELLGLRWPDVDFAAERVLFTHTKGKRDRAVPMMPETMRTLLELQSETMQIGPFTGMGPKIGCRRKGMWRKIVAAAGLTTWATMHDMRKTFVCRLIRAGADLPAVQKLAGHEDIETTLKYYHEVTDDDIRGAMGKLAKRVG